MSESAHEPPLITADGTLRVKWAVAIAVIGFTIALVSAHNALDKRISSLETTSKIQVDDVREIKQDVKTILRMWPAKGP